MEELEDCLNPSLYDSVLVALVKKNELCLALSIFFLETSDGQSDETSGVTVSYIPGIVIVNELLVGIRRADMRAKFKPVFEKLKGMERFKFGEMQYNGFVPDTIVYNSLLDGTLKARKVTKACHLFEKMVQEGVRASCWTYNILIDGLFRNGRAEAAFTLFCDLKKKSQFVYAINFSIVVLQLCREVKLEGAMKLVEEMETRGFSVDMVTITSLLIGFHKQGRWDWKEKLMKHIREGNLVPNVLRWNTGVEASLKCPQTKDKDYTPMFPNKGSFLDIMSMVGSEDDGARIEEVSAMEDDPWSSSPYMDQLAHQRNSSKPLFGLARL